jgi:hypothetical protein
MSARISGPRRRGLFRRPQADTRNPPVSLAHSDDLHSVLAVVRTSVELESTCHYGDAASGEQSNREAVHAHFGELALALAAWDAEVARARAAPSAVWGWFERSAADRDITEPPFALGSLVDCLSILTLERSRRWELGVAYPLRFEQFDERVASESCVSLYVEGQRAAQLTVAPVADIDRRLQGARRSIQALFDEAQISDCAREISDSRDSLLELKHDLTARLAPPAQPSRVRFAADCPHCAAHEMRPR